MTLQLGALQQLWGAPASGALDPDQAELRLRQICTDSRQLQAGDLYVPLIGERFDGHGFLEAAIAAGCRALLAQPERLTPAAAEQLPAQASAAGCHLWWVEDSQLAYQQLATCWRRQLTLQVVAVTGSAGKTTTRQLIQAALAPLGPIQASSGNQNNDIGVPLTLLSSSADHRAVVVEMGMRGLGEIERLSRCAEPDLAVITNIGTAHIGRLGSREAIAQAKCEITAQLHPDGAVVIPAGDPLLEAALARVWTGRVVRIALADEAGSAHADLLGEYLEADSSLRLGQLSLALPLPGRHNARNLLLALAVAELLGVPPELLTALQVDVPDGRHQRRLIGGITVLDETYNASPEAVLAALELLNSQPGRRFAVLGKMLELGDQSLELHRQVGSRAAELGLDGLVVVAEGAEGEAMLAAAAGLPRLVGVASPEQAAPPLEQWLQPGDCLLLKASRGVALERLLPLLEQQFTAVDQGSPK